VKVSERCRVLVFGLGLESSGIPYHWAAGANRPGVRLLADLSRETSLAFAPEVLKQKRTGDIAVISIHWGSNWGHHITPAQVDFAHALIDLGACDVLHGHSSHHARAIEIYRGKLILYGCGDFINDYEGIEGHKKYGGDLAVMYLPEVNEADGSLAALSLVLFQVRGFRLRRASLSDTRSFQSVLNRHSQKFATRLLLDGDGNLAVVPIF
jgi:poly-gamma-glutamate capsule biosynthesis protein CapA/YwtB (metallophosphatase superfamily)